MQDTAHIRALLDGMGKCYPVTDDAGMSAILGDVFNNLAGQLRQRAADMAAKKKKGWKGTGEMLEFAAVELNATASELLAYSFTAAGAPLDAVPIEADPFAKVDFATVEIEYHEVGYVKPFDPDSPGCAAETCGGSRLDPCATVMRTKGARHDAEAAEMFPGQCADPEPAGGTQKCMLPARHTGTHIGDRGAKWPQVAPAVDPAISELAAMAEQAKATMAPSAAIPKPRKQIVAAGDGYEVITTVPASLSNVAVLEHDTTGGRFVEIVGTMSSVDPMPGMWEHADITGGATDQPEHKVGDVVTVGGIEFVKHSELPTPAAIFGGFEIVGSAPDAPRAPLWLPPDAKPPKEVLSPSSIETMAGCGMKYRLRYRDGVGSDKPAWYLIGGTVVHEVVRRIESAAFYGTAFTTDYAPSQLEGAASVLFRDELKATMDKTAAETGVSPDKWRVNSKNEGMAWWSSKGEEMVRSYLHYRPTWLHKWQLLTDPTGQLVQEYKVEAEFGGVKMLGYIDSAWIERPEFTLGSTPPKVHVKDYKSGTHKPDDPLQLQFYAAALQQMGVPYEIEGSNLMTRKMEETAPVTLDGAAEVLAYRAQATQAADAAGLFIPRPSNMCGYCDVSHACPIMKMKR